MKTLKGVVRWSQYLLKNSPQFLLVSASCFVLSSCSDFKSIPGSDEPLTTEDFSIVSPTNNSLVNTLSHTVSGICTPGAFLTVTGDVVGSPLSISCAGVSSYSRAITLTSGDGSKNLMMTLQGQSIGLNLVINLDATAPLSPTIASHVGGAMITSTSQTITGACETGSTVSITGNITGSPVTATCASGAYTRAVSFTSGDGVKTLNVNQRDLAGNSSAVRTISLTLNATVPSAPTITSPVSNVRVNSVSQTITGSCLTGTTVSVSGQISGSPVTTSCVSSAFTRAITLTTGDGVKSINVTQSNGNVSPAASLTINLDTVAPSAPTISSHSNAATITAVAQTITGACEAGASVSITGNITGSPVTTSCASSSYSRAVTFTSGDGSKTLNVSQTDLAGNASTLRTISLSLNTAVPAPTISSPSNGVRVNVVAQTITGSCVTGSTVSVSGNITGSPVTTTCASSAYSRAVTLTTGDGAKSINVIQNNGVTDSPQVSLTINLDTTAPTMPTITTPANASTVTALAQTVTGACETSATVTVTGNVDGAPLTTTCASSSYSRSVNLTSGNGTKTINVTQRDVAGNASSVRTITITLDIASGNPNWGPVNTTRLLLSGHSLTDNPLADYLVDITSKTSDSFNYNQQIVIGSPLRVRTKGNDTGSAGWSGYAQGKNRDGGSGINFVNEVRNPATLGVGERYDTLVVTENHSSLGQIRWENTVGYLRHYQDLMISGNANTRTFFYHSWLDVNKSDPTGWITYEEHAATTWECVASKVNAGLQTAGRADRVRLLPAGGALVDLVERVVADQVPGITGTTTAKLNMIFSDNVHLTSLGSYFISLVVYSSTYGKSPSGVAPPSGSGVNTTLAGHLQTIAWNYVNAYYSQGTDPSARTMSSCRTFISNNTCTSYFTLLGQTNEISGCQSFFGNNGGDNPFRDAALTVLPAP